MERTERQIEANKEAAALQPKAVEIQLRDAIYEDERNKFIAKNDGRLPSKEEDASILRKAAEQAKLNTDFALLDMKDQLENRNTAREVYTEQTNEEALEQAIINNTGFGLGAAAKAVRANPNDENARKTYDDAVEAWKKSQAEKISNTYRVPVNEFTGFTAQSDSGALDLGAEAESFGGTIRQ